MWSHLRERSLFYSQGHIYIKEEWEKRLSYFTFAKSGAVNEVFEIQMDLVKVTVGEKEGRPPGIII